MPVPNPTMNWSVLLPIETQEDRLTRQASSRNLLDKLWGNTAVRAMDTNGRPVVDANRLNRVEPNWSAPNGDAPSTESRREANGSNTQSMSKARHV